MSVIVTVCHLCSRLLLISWMDYLYVVWMHLGCDLCVCVYGLLTCKAIRRVSSVRH